MKSLRLSVHQLVDFLLRKGDIDNRIYNKSSMSEGTRLHAFYQHAQDKDYLAEQYLCETIDVDDFEITLEGRADGIINHPFVPIIDEIKTTVIDLKSFFESQKDWHLGQAKCYAWMFAKDRDLRKIGVRLTYISQVNDEKMVKNFTYTVEELEQEIIGYIKDYLSFYRLIEQNCERRNASVKDLPFPFPSFRKGQRELSKYTYGVLSKGGVLYAEAPTGIGKTMSTLYPAVKTFQEENHEKIFYLTAKNSGKESAFLACEKLKESGLEGKVIVISAKEKMCACPGRGCNPDECPFAKGYYDKIRGILEKSIKEEDTFTKDKMQKIAMEFGVCPFECQLDLSLYCDIIICDFNYLFDPGAYMRRYFDGDCSQYIALIDEAHNLVERGRDMYSASISSKDFSLITRSEKCKEFEPFQKAYRRMKKQWKKYEDLEDGENTSSTPDEELIRVLSQFQKNTQALMKKHPMDIPESLKDYFFATMDFLRSYEYFDDHFTWVIKKEKKDIEMKILCLDPSLLIKDKLQRLKGAVIFSATLSPMDYYIRLLGGDSLSPVLQIPSPFPRENCLRIFSPYVETTYKKRDNSYEEIARYIDSFTKIKTGNYLVFFPSYKYLENVYERMEEKSFIATQTPDMNEEEKKEFLDKFEISPSKTHIGFVVLGGSFSEGIDLMNDRLIGAVIVGVGLPQISFERDLIRQYFDEQEEDGFAYAYRSPGMNRVLQAMGRVIRSEQDHGAILLLDRRYCFGEYQAWLQGENQTFQKVFSPGHVEEVLEQFWKKSEETSEE